MSVEMSEPRSRRALLAAAAGAAVATVASALGRPGPVSAADGDIVKVGGEYTASSVTKIDTEATGAVALWGNSVQSTGVYGTSNEGSGAECTSYWGCGVIGGSTHGMGVSGYTSATNQPALRAWSQGNSTGAFGFSGPPARFLPFLPRPASTATRPRTRRRSGCRASRRPATAPGYQLGRGVSGTSSSNVGVFGASTSSYGMLAMSTSQSGLYAVSNGAAVPAVIGRSQANRTGLAGFSDAGSGSVPAAPAKTGVYGYAAQDAGSSGVQGVRRPGAG